MKILSWNVNGIRAMQKKGFLDWLYKESPDILCIQETKAQKEQLTTDLINPTDYYTYWNSAERKGYSGVAIFSKTKPLLVENNLGINRFDVEGRVIIAHYPEFTLYNIYFPNGRAREERLEYKMDFNEELLSHFQNISDEKKIILCGDLNTAHKEIDLARPKENSKVSGFLPMERNWIDRLESENFVDVFRFYNSEPENYTYWDTITRARERNVGWRIDYFFVKANFLSEISNASIMADVMGSDHCPISINIE
ncbi:MAG: exodeoxyribonuclease III [Chloroflexi bacterium]|nr:exodeoxyribonuclease III [Chloroflexota bacterium]|tara:strand:- start:19499 stop:20257 length:759 start_codon:yes stop_codon:yes gene_type:complete